MTFPLHTPIDLLLIEDTEADARLIQAILLEDAPQGFHVVRAASLGEGLRLLESAAFDLVLLDLSLPDSQGLDGLASLRARHPLVPVVVLTGLADDALALTAMQQGAQDYMVKGQGSNELLRRSIRYAVERSNAERSLRRSEATFRAVFENAGLGILLLDDQARILSLNPRLTELLAQPAGKTPPPPLLALVEEENHPAFLRNFRRLLDGRMDGFSLELRFLPQEGRVMRWGAATVSLVRAPDGQPQFAVMMVEDITARKSLEDQLRLAAKVVEATSEGIIITDRERRIIHVNPAFTRLTGYAPHEALGADPSLLSSGRHDQAFYDHLWQSISEEGGWSGEIWNRRKDGQLIAEWLNISAVRNDSGQLSNYVAVFSDITRRKQDEERLSHRAHHDPLTGLPNRALFTERLDHAIARSMRNQLNLAVLFLDLDLFKQINDSLGHLAGDTLLQQVAERLTRTVRAEDTVARLGGDEFTLILEDIGDFRDAAKVAHKILEQFAIPFPLNGQPCQVSTSIGIGLYPKDATTPETLLHAADEAMYTAKKQGRDSFRFASADLSEQAFEHNALEQALARAVDNGQMQVYYQPMIDLTDGRVMGAEALLRWQHPEIGLMAPRQFLPLATETGLIRPLGRWIMDQAFGQAAQWRQSHPGLHIAINVSRTELLDQGFLARVEELLARHGLPPAAVEIDISESVALEALPATVTALEALRLLGLHVALDDFGTDHTDFRLLHSLPVDVVKIAPAHIRALNHSGDQARLVRSAIAMARDLNIRVLAKAVETSAQFTFLQNRHCHGAQGFLFSRPVPAGEFAPLLDRILAPK